MLILTNGAWAMHFKRMTCWGQVNTVNNRDVLTDFISINKRAWLKKNLPHNPHLCGCQKKLFPSSCCQFLLCFTPCSIRHFSVSVPYLPGYSFFCANPHSVTGSYKDTDPVWTTMAHFFIFDMLHQHLNHPATILPQGFVTSTTDSCS